MKRAFVGRAKGSIRLEPSSAGGRVRLAVSDDGIGRSGGASVAAELDGDEARRKPARA